MAAFRTGIFAAAIVLSTWFVYSPAIRGAWLWDDPGEIAKHPVLLNPAGLRTIWAAPDGPDYFPLTTTVQWFQWRLWGRDPVGYHATNIGLHALNALLFWRLLRRLGVGMAWLGGLVFAVHPLAVESVAWVAEIKNVLSLALLLLATIRFVDYDEHRRGRDLCLSLAWFLAAMLAKTSVAMFPLVILLYAWWKRRRIAWSDLRASAGFFVISAVLGLATVWFQQERAMGGAALYSGGILSRMAGAGLAAVFYLGKCVWPLGLLPIYPRWRLDPPSLLQFVPWLAFGSLAAFLRARSGISSRAALLSLAFFLLNLLPVLGFVPMAYLRISWVADHFAYLPLLGAIGLAVAAWGEVGNPALRRTVAAVAVVVLAVEARAHAEIFRGPAALWEFTVERNPEAWLAENNLASDLLRHGRVQGAIAHGRRALAIRPDYPDALNTLGNALGEAGRLPDAIDCYQRAIRIEPTYAETHGNLGVALCRAGRFSEGIRHLEEAVRLKPGLAPAQANLGSALASVGRLTEAIAHFRKAIELVPDYAAARENLIRTLRAAGRDEEAAAESAQAARLKSNLR